MKSVDKKTKAELVDIANVKIDVSKPREDRMREYLEQVRNPYEFRSHGVSVKISFTGEKTLTECLAQNLSVQ